MFVLLDCYTLVIHVSTVRYSPSDLICESDPHPSGRCHLSKLIRTAYQLGDDLVFHRVCQLTIRLAETFIIK